MELGKGSYGIVCKAVKANNKDEYVAIKKTDIIRLPQKDIESMKKEINFLIDCKRENKCHFIVGVLDFDVTAKTMKYAMDFYEKGDLKQYLKANPKEKENQGFVKSVLFGMLKALHFLNENNVVTEISSLKIFS